MFNKLIIYILFGAFYLNAAIVNSQNKKSDSLLFRYEGERPELDGHTFISNSIVEGPFLNSKIDLTTGFGSSLYYDVPLEINGEEVKGLFGEMYFGSVDIKYQQKIKNWIAFAASVNIQGRYGSQIVSFVNEGIDVLANYSIGWQIKTLEGKKFLLTTSFLLNHNTITYFKVNEFVEKVIENGGITPDNKFVEVLNVTSGSAGFRAAYAISRIFGCVGKFRFGYGEAISGTNKGYFDAGISVDADLDPKLSVPIGFTLAYNWNNFSQTDVSFNNPQNILFSLNYTGRKDFEMGLEMQTQFFSQTIHNSNINSQIFFLNAGIKYYF